MTKFQKFQKLSSIVPFFSSIFVFFVTMITLKRERAAAKNWFYFIVTFFLSGIAVYLINQFVMTGQHPLLNGIVSGLVLAVANILCVDIQANCMQEARSGEPKKDRRHIVIICSIMAGVALLCAAVVLAIMLVTPAVSIEDSNGSDTHLAVITMDEILNTNNDFSAFHSRWSNKGTQTNVERRTLEKFDYEDVVFSCERISGIKTLQVTKANCDRLTLTVESTLEAGNMEIVIIIDNELFDTVAVNQAQTITLNDIQGKQVTVKVAAESAKMSISVKRTLS